MESIGRLLLELRNYLSQLAFYLDHPVEYDAAADLQALRRAVGFALALQGEEPLERLLSFLTIYNDLLSGVCVVLLRAKGLFSEEELHELYRAAAHHKWRLLLLESEASLPLEGEVHYLIDRDFCVLSGRRPEES